MILAAALAVAMTLEQQLMQLERAGAICSGSAVKTFYRRHGYARAWNAGNAAALERAIARAADDALDPADYATGGDAGEARDIRRTDAFVTLAAHLSRGRVNPDAGWCVEPQKLDLAAVLESAIRDGTVEQTLAALTPRHASYRRLRDAYNVYRAMSDWPVVSGGKALRLGRHGRRVRELRARLGAGTGDHFDEELEARVREFQRRHGLVDDGVVGRTTLREINVPRKKRLEQLAVNLERWRWMPADLGARHLLVNIAAFQLDLFDDGSSSLTMKIIAGKQYKETPFFSAAVERVLVNPPWNVPSSIAYGELWPKQRHDLSYFRREHIRVVAGGRLRQDPGPWCALGRIKFDMPNRYNVYLHDTPAKTLFASDVRAFSHGCIRLEKPVELAMALTGKSREEIEALIETGKETPIPLDRKVPVHVLYWTAYVAADGELEFRRDVYKRDEALRKELSVPLRTAP